MTFPQFVAQVWRLARVGGVAALAASQAASKVASGDHKTLIIAGAVAGVEAVYRAAVPVADQSLFEKWYLAIKAVAANPAVAPELKALEAETPARVLSKAELQVLGPQAPARVLSAAEQAIADAGIKPPAAQIVPQPTS